MIALERTDISQSSSSDSFAKVLCSVVNESEVVINSAVTLCGVAAKKVALHLCLFDLLIPRRKSPLVKRLTEIQSE